MMKHLYIIAAGIFLFAGCMKKLEVNEPVFDVKVEKSNWRAGEEVKFRLTGNPDLISFYSGEPLHDYAFAAGRIVETAGLELSFNTSVEFGKQVDQLSVMASVDFNGGARFEDITAATWTDITNRFKLAGSATYTPSGKADITDLKTAGKPLYLAFRYRVKNPSVYGTGNVWRVQNFLLTAQTSIGAIQLGSTLNGGFRIFDQKPDIAPSRSTISATTLQLIAPALADSTRTVDTECWIVTKGMETGDLDYGPDRPASVKGYADPAVTETVYVYPRPGRYRAVFTAFNANIAGSKEMVREVEIEIVP